MADLPSGYARLSYQTWHSDFLASIATHAVNATPSEGMKFRDQAVAQCFLIAGDTLAGVRVVVKFGTPGDRQFQNAYAVDGSGRVYVKICNLDKQRVTSAWEKARVADEERGSSVKVIFPVFKAAGQRPETEKICTMRVLQWTPAGVFLEPLPASDPPPKPATANNKKRSGDMRSYFGPAPKKAAP